MDFIANRSVILCFDYVYFSDGKTTGGRDVEVIGILCCTCMYVVYAFIFPL